MPSAIDDARPYVSAVTILMPARVHVVFVRSCGTDGIDAACLHTPQLRSQVDRNARPFATLDDAMQWADRQKAGWLGRGWTECSPDPRDR